MVITFYTKVSMMSIFFSVALDIIIYPAPHLAPSRGKGFGDRDSKQALFKKTGLNCNQAVQPLVYDFMRFSVARGIS